MASPLAASRPRKRCWSTWPGSNAKYYERRPDLGDPNQTGQLRHQRPPRHVAARHLHRGAHPGHHPGHLRLPPRPGHRRPALHGQGHARAVRAGPAHRARGAGGQRRRDRHPARRRRHADAGHLARHPRLQPRPQGASRRRHRHHAVAQSARGRRLQVQPDQRRPGRHRRDQVGPGPGQRTAARRQRRREARAVRRGDQGGDHAPGRLRPALRRRPAQRHRHGRDPRRRPQARRRSARRRGRALLGADQRSLRAGHHSRQPEGRSDLLVHDRRSRRQDPHGLLQPVRDGAARRAQGSVPRRVRQRPGLRTGTASSRRRPG